MGRLLNILITKYLFKVQVQRATKTKRQRQKVCFLRILIARFSYIELSCFLLREMRLCTSLNKYYQQAKHAWLLMIVLIYPLRIFTNSLNFLAIFSSYSLTA